MLFTPGVVNETSWELCYLQPRATATPFASDMVSKRSVKIQSISSLSCTHQPRSKITPLAHPPRHKLGTPFNKNVCTSCYVSLKGKCVVWIDHDGAITLAHKNSIPGYQPKERKVSEGVVCSKKKKTLPQCFNQPCNDSVDNNALIVQLFFCVQLVCDFIQVPVSQILLPQCWWVWG